jgi:predicted nucleic acid-binding protein
MNKVLDSSLWVAYFAGEQSVKQLIEQGGLITSTMVIAELADLFERNNLLFEKELLFIKSTSKIVPLTTEIALLSAKIKTNQRKKKNKFGLADAIVYATAIVHDAELITKDKDFEGLQQVVFL